MSKNLAEVLHGWHLWWYIWITALSQQNHAKSSTLLENTVTGNQHYLGQMNLKLTGVKHLQITYCKCSTTCENTNCYADEGVHPWINVTWTCYKTLAPKIELYVLPWRTAARKRAWSIDKSSEVIMTTPAKYDIQRYCSIHQKTLFISLPIDDYRNSTNQQFHFQLSTCWICFI